MPSIKYKKKTYAGATFPVLEMTKAEYDALPEAKKMDGTVYMITDDTGGWEAEDSAYDNTESGLTATNVQDALDEINANQSPVIKTVTYTLGTNVSYRGLTVRTIGNIAFVDFYFDALQNLSNNQVVLTVSPAFPSPSEVYAVAAVHGIGSDSGMVQISNENPNVIQAWGVIPKATYYYAQFVYRWA